MYTNFYTLPEVSFVGGATQVLKFDLVEDTGDAFDTDNCAVNFSIIDYSARNPNNAISIISLTPDISGSMVTVTIPAETTKNLVGKYIYQMTVHDSGDGSGDEYQIPNQGIMYIAQNINPAYITTE